MRVIHKTIHTDSHTSPYVKVISIYFWTNLHTACQNWNII